MRREQLVDGAVAAALVPLALAVALPFRQIAVARTPLLALGWDAALHATEGLDLFDDLRLARPLDALSLLVSRHWWGPLWAVVSAPFQAVFGPSLSAASLPSLVAFVLTPSVAYLLVRRLAPGGLLVAAATSLLATVLFLRSPMLLETSAWPMLESLGGFLVLLAWLLFARRSEPRARRTAFLAGAGLFLLKYHYGFFVLVTFSVVVVLEETADARRRLGAAARAVLLRGAGAGILALACLLAAVRLILQARGGDAAARGAPSVPNVGWGAFVLLGFLLVLRRKQLAQAWNGASGTLRDFFLFGLLPPALWCLDPANVRGWYRQVFQPTDTPEWNPVAKLGAFGSFLRDDYTLGAAPAGLVLFGLLLALLLPGDRTRRALAAFVVWPVLLMSFATYPVEPRFLASLAPGLLAAAAAGLLAGPTRLGERGRGPALGVLAAAALLLVGREPDRWRAERDARAPYRYAYGATDTAAVKAAIASAPAAGPIRLRLPAEPLVWPTARLALRLARRDLAPVDVDVSAGSP
jgi:4-amino-4-deoxy-L-arabinose transferase-like glycosyltransferase